MAAIIIGIADMKIARAPDMLTTLGLGSCVGITLYDPIQKIGGLSHIMLPEYNGQIDQNRAKFADTAIPDLIAKMCMQGARRAPLVAKIAGGAHMFTGSSSQNFLKIGERNVESVMRMLRNLNVPIKGSDTGGTHGRTIELDLNTGRLKIKTVGFGESFI